MKITREYIGKNISEAIKAGLEDLNMKEEDVNISILSEGGLFNKAKVEISYDIAEEKTEEVVVEEKAEVATEKKVKKEVNKNVNPLEVAENFVKEFITAIDPDAEVVAVKGEHGDKVLVKTATAGKFIGYYGDGLENIQTILNQIVRNEARHYKRIMLDINDYRKEKDEALVEKATNIADKVEALGISRNLEPMNSYDRHLIHEALAERKGVKTHSEGEGKDRHLVISPVEA